MGERRSSTAAGRCAGILTARGGLPLTVTSTQGVQSTGTGNRPNRICDGRLANPTIDKWFDTRLLRADDRDHRDLRRCRPRHHPRTGVVQHRRLAHQEHEDRPLPRPRFRVEAFNILNHPQFGNPNTTVGNAAYGTISTMLSSPSCSLCGTVERQVQLAIKVRF